MANTLFPMLTLFPSLYGRSPKCLGKAQIPEESHPARSALEFGSSVDLDLNLCCAKLQGFGSSNYFLTCLLRLTQYSTCVYAKSLQSCLFVTPWTVVCWASLFMGFSKREYWSGWPCPPLGDLPNPGIEPISLMFPALVGGFFTTNATCKAPSRVQLPSIFKCSLHFSNVVWRACFNPCYLREGLCKVSGFLPFLKS